MKHPLFLRCLMAAGIALAASSTHAADIRINGFASIGAGKTLGEGTSYSPDPSAANPIAAPSLQTKNTYSADQVTDGVYDEDWKFKPDSNFGLQIAADLGSGLSVTGQVTGNGGEDFDAVISWAYVGYEFNDNWSVMAGRQRLPLFYYSDFIDVGYAYHWIRPPQDLASANYDTLEGVKLRYTNHIGNWDWSASAYYGSGDEEVSNGQAEVESEDAYGIVLQTENDWLVLRGTYFHNSLIIDSSSGFFDANQVEQGTEDNPSDYTFMAFAAHMTFDNVFVVTEWTNAEPDDGAVNPYNGLGGQKEDTGWYISSGIRLGDFTPHITYGQRVVDYEIEGGPLAPPGATAFKEKSATITVGVRWDFHPSAALKLEYLTRSDKSDDYFQGDGTAFSGARIFGYGDRNEVDLVAMSLDVIF